MGSVFPIYEDCEIDGLSAYIMGGLADGLIDFEYTLWKADYYRITGEIIDPIYLTQTESSAKLIVTDFLGQTVITKDIGLQQHGVHETVIQDHGLSPGIYFYTLYAGDNQETKKMVIVK